MEKKKLAVLLAVLLLAGAAACAGIYAYLSAEDSRVNRLTFGQNIIETEEEFPTPDPKPGDSIEKKVRVKNTGDVPCFVRKRICSQTGMRKAYPPWSLTKRTGQRDRRMGITTINTSSLSGKAVPTY